MSFVFYFFNAAASLAIVGLLAAAYNNLIPEWIVWVGVGGIVMSVIGVAMGKYLQHREEQDRLEFERIEKAKAERNQLDRRRQIREAQARAGSASPEDVMLVQQMGRLYDFPASYNPASGGGGIGNSDTPTPSVSTSDTSSSGGGSSD